MIPQDILSYNALQTEMHTKICNKLSELTDQYLTESTCKIWHAHPVWFLNDNPIVGYSKQKKGIRLMFWSGKSFDEALLNIQRGKFQDASVFYNDVSEIIAEDVIRWLEKAETIQWDYKNLIKRKGELLRLK